MELQHHNKLESALWFVEKLLREIEDALYRKGGIYASVHIDLDQAQSEALKKLLKEIYSILEETKRALGLKSKRVELSRVIEANTGFIWETVEETRPARMEKTSGKAIPEGEKKEIDRALRRILELSNKIREAAGNSS